MSALARLDRWRHDPATFGRRLELALAAMFVTGFVAGAAVSMLLWALRP